jgi:hypothetical protein
MLNGRAYVVTSPALAVAVQRAASTLDFDQLIVEVTPRLVGSSAETRRILLDPTAKEEGRTRMVTRSHTVINPPLIAHRKGDMSQNQLSHMSERINSIWSGEDVEIFKFVTRALMAASMHSFYGPHNPFAVHPDLLEKYWDWDSGIVGYAVNILPKLTARKAYYGLEACAQGFLEYTKNGFYTEALPFLQERKKMHEDVGIPDDEHARLDMGISFGFISNAGITTFWIVNNIFSRPELLQQIREEICTNAFEAPGTISSSQLRDACPLLNSVFRETMRINAPMTSARYVLEDTLIADTYLLRKGNVVQISGGVLHSDTEIWGPDVSSFNARRFYHNVNGSKTDQNGNIISGEDNAVHPAFRGFGGGKTLCPGRHFAQMEITSMAAILAMGFDMLPPKGTKSVAWDPMRNDKKFPFAATKPVRDISVRLQRREGYENVKWELKV